MGAVGSWPRRRGRPPGRQRGPASIYLYIHPPVASARLSRAPALGRPAPSLTSDGAQACSMHVTVLYACDVLLENVQEGPRRNARGRGRGRGLSLSSSLVPGHAQACARSLSFLSSPSPLCPV